MVRELKRRRGELMRRLDAGDDRIWEREKASGKSAPKAWVDTWLDLLTEYEQVERELRRERAAV